MPAKKNIPLDLQIAFRDLLNDCKTLAAKYSNTVTFTYDFAFFTIEFADIEPNSPFFFTIKEPQKTEFNNSNQLTATFIKFPRHVGKMEQYANNGQIGALPSAVEEWINTVEKFNSFNVEPEDDIEKLYTDEFFMQMDSSDPDANKAPFDDEKQEKLVKLLNGIAIHSENIDHQTPELKLIAQEARELSDTVQRLPKNKVLEKLSKIFGKIKMQAPGVIKEILKEAAKEGLKFILKEGFEGAQHGLQLLLNHGG